MTDYRDFQSANYDHLGRERLDAEYAARRSGAGMTGAWIALVVIVLAMLAIFAFVGPEPTTTVQNSTAPGTTMQTPMPAPTTAPTPAPAEPTR